MIKHTGHADLPLHTGIVPKWLADRMMQMGTLIVESIIENFGKKEVLVRLSDPLWFQSLGAVMGMDWHSSGITTSVMYALKRGINARAREFGLCVCGGRGKYSRRTPDELKFLADATGLDGTKLINTSKLVAKVDSTAVQDGFQLYMHNFILSSDGDWTVVQQGMNTELKTARRYHWSSQNLRSFLDEPHTGVTGENRGLILNLTAENAAPTRQRILDFTKESPDRTLKEIQNVIKHDDSKILIPQKNEIIIPEENKILVQKRDIVMPVHHEVRAEDVNLKRLGAVLATAYESEPKDFENLLLTPGLGPRTIQSLTLVSEVIYGTPSRFTDPARFSFAHGGKDGHPFPVPLKVYDESIRILHESIERSKLGYKDKNECIKRLHTTALEIEKYCNPVADFDKTIEHDKEHSREWDGRSE
ncbi:MAG: DUF763 domain-containing protein [Treponema sp.]|uniref:DUF763 domain-containing protein n=1 Tax=Treponema sp. TaxID=166 RepID=UPI00298E85A5|nr:DUF763 domain-containing protein [Treponema sp.]MBR5932774.1 DUF763 domain-containing protein [Treponema sp.]